MNCHLLGLETYLPERERTCEDLVALNPDWDAAKIFAKTGIRSRRVAAPDQTASDLGYEAALELLDKSPVAREEIDALIFCTQSPDYFLPTTACILQEKLGLPQSCGAFDINLGCSGFTYGLWLARSLILSESAKNVLLVMAETYSRYCREDDLSTVTIFGDGGAAALLGASTTGAIAMIGPSIVGSDGRGAENLIVRGGAARAAALPSEVDEDDCYLSMDGPEIFSFVLGVVQQGIDRLLEKTSMTREEVDLFLMHQANRFVLNSLRQTGKIPSEKLPLALENHGNTVSASIPLLIDECRKRDLLRPGSRCVLAGFGVGYSWAMTQMTWGPPRVT